MEKIMKWNMDPDKSENPYEDSKEGEQKTYLLAYKPIKFYPEIHILQVRRILSESEKYENIQGSLQPDSISATHWLSVGIELEDMT